MTLTTRGAAVRILPYPAGKLFAFTIVDDTDGQTLETTRAVYDVLRALGLRTTKTLWVAPPRSGAATCWDEGDTLQSPEYCEYHRDLQRHGFEIALHNVSSQSNTRDEIARGLDTFRRVFGEDPKINVHHEKNLENLYFGIANSPSRLPGAFHSRFFRQLRKVRRLRSPRESSPSFACSGERPESPYFWGDLCRQHIKYVRTNVFLTDLNTIKGCPAMPVSYEDTPYVNYWFYASEGQDAAHFNRLLSPRNVRQLRIEHGASILYTHFGKGFVAFQGGRPVLNRETEARLTHIAAQKDGWFAPAGEVLDRLLAFQSVLATTFAGGFLVRNDNPFPVCDVTLLTPSRASFFSPEGLRSTADADGRLLVREIGARQTMVFFNSDVSAGLKNWLAPTRPAWLLDLEEAMARLRKMIPGRPRVETIPATQPGRNTTD